MLNLGLTEYTPNEKHIYTQQTIDTVVKLPIILLTMRTGIMVRDIALAFNLFFSLFLYHLSPIAPTWGTGVHMNLFV